MRLLLTPVLILYVIVGMFACADAGDEASDRAPATPATEAVGSSPSRMGN